MVSRSYMLEKPPGPPGWKRAFDQEVMPVLIDLAGGLEQVVEGVAVGVRARPILAVAVGVGVGVVLGVSGLGSRARGVRG